MMKGSQRPDGQTPKALMWQTVLKGWDFRIAMAVGWAVLLLGLFPQVLPFETSDHVPLWPVVALTTAISLGVWGTERWLNDRLRESDYGELVRVIDPQSQALTLPYHVTAVVSFTAALVTAGATLVTPLIRATEAHAVLYALAAFFCTWSVVGFIEVLSITRSHIHRESEIRSLREQKAFEGRQAQRRRQRNGT